jgi:hypothetical protein
MTAVLLFGIGIGAAACEFGEHRGSHSNVYPGDDRYYDRPYQSEYRPYYEHRPYY